MRVSHDVGQADWIVASVRPFAECVGSLVPVGFERYARVFHPPHYRGESVRWADVAAANGRVSHPLMEWTALTGSWRHLHAGHQEPAWDEPPSVGSLPRPPAAALSDVLGRFTHTPTQCWFGVWEGWGGTDFPPDGAPRFNLPERAMVLFSGHLRAVTTSVLAAPFDQRASLWWPDDRAWCVATDVDLMSTYVSGSAACIAAVLADPRLEAMPVSVDDKVSWDADTSNPPARDKPF